MSLVIASSSPNINIRDLPNELLLQIVHYLVVEPRFDRDAYKDLTSLAAANSRFPGVIRTTFQDLKSLIVPLPKAFALFRTLRDFPATQWADRSLEITNYVSPEAQKANYGGDEDGCMRMPRKSAHKRQIQRRLRDGLVQYKDAQRRSKMPSRQFNIETDVAFRMDCLDIIRDNDEVSNRNKRAWEDALRAGHSNAFLALLLLTLPHLEELLLGGGHIFHYPMLLRDADPWHSPMGPSVDGRCHWTNDISTQQLREHKYLAQVFEAKYSRLTKLEMPSSWSGIALSRAIQLSPIYHQFDDLQALIIPESALPQSHIVRSDGPLFSALPVTLRYLTIVDCTDIATQFVQSLLHDRAVVPTTHLPDLRFIRTYYVGTPAIYTILGQEDNKRAATLGIEMDVFYLGNIISLTTLMASDVGGQPWRLSRDELFEMARSGKRERIIREVAGHWIGSKYEKVPAGKAKEHFRNRRGYWR